MRNSVVIARNRVHYTPSLRTRVKGRSVNFAIIDSREQAVVGTFFKRSILAYGLAVLGPRCLPIFSVAETRYHGR